MAEAYRLNLGTPCLTVTGTASFRLVDLWRRVTGPGEEAEGRGGAVLGRRFGFRRVGYVGCVRPISLRMVVWKRFSGVSRSFPDLAEAWV